MADEEHNNRIDLYEELDLDRLLALEHTSPRDVDLIVAIGRRYLKQRQLRQCHAYYTKALAVAPDDGWTYLYMGNLYYGLACYTEAITHFQRAAELLPGVACPHWCLADVYKKQGYWSRTEQEYRRAVETDPADETAKQKLDAWLVERQSSNQGL